MDAMGRMGAALGALALSVMIASAVEVKLERVKEGMGGYFPFNVPVADEPPETLVKQPAYAGKPRYAAVKMGNGADSIITVALDDEANPPKVYVDKNNDEDLTNDGDGAWATYGKPMPGQKDRFANSLPLELAVNYSEGGEEFQLPYWITMYRFFGADRSEADQHKLFYYPTTKLIGKLELDGQSAMVVLAESYATGDFSAMMEKPQSRGVGGIMIDYNGDGKIETDRRMPEMLGTDQSVKISDPFHFNGKSYAVKSISPSGRSMTVEPVDVPTDPPVWPELPKVAVGDVPPQFTATDLDGKPCNLADLKGKVVLLDFWATWCGPCMAEVPNVTPVWMEFKDKDFVIVGISLDSMASLLSCNLERTDQAARVANAQLARNIEAGSATADQKKGAEARALREFRAFIDRHGMTWRHIYDGKYWKAEIAQMYDVRSIPAMFLLDRSGKIIKKNNELRGEGKLRAAVKEALVGKASTDAAPAGKGTRTSALGRAMPARRLLADASPAVGARLQNIRPLTLNLNRGPAKVVAGHPAPAFSGVTVDGKTVNLADYRGKVVLLDFMGTWCGPCRGELPYIAAAWEKFKDRDFMVLSIAHERSGSLWTCQLDQKDPDFKAKYAAARETAMANHKIVTTTDGSVSRQQQEALLAEGRRNLETFLKNYSVTWPMVLDGPYFGASIYSDYGVMAYPTLYLLDREGKVIQTGNIRHDNLIPAVEAALSGAPQPSL
ncbi:TlpA family protein disulfide reductase [bacterium]|nr:TlpA family protein disulfide reductase [bacterium]